MIEQLTGLSKAPVLQEVTLKEMLKFGGNVTILGVTIVFLALVALIGLTMLYPIVIKAILGASAACKEKKAAKKQAKLAKKQHPVTADVVKAMPNADTIVDDTALIAVITAAIAASMGTSGNGIVIKSLRRSGANMSSWGRESRSEQVYNRF